MWEQTEMCIWERTEVVLGFGQDWIGEREVKVNPQRQNGGQSILPILFYAEIKIELHGES
jgi:hypothetical protein